MPQPQNNIEKRFFVAEFRTEDTESRTVVGHAAVFNTWGDGGWFREKISPGAFANALNSSDIRALFNHDPNHLLARNTSGTLRVEEDEQGLRVEFDLPKSAESIRESIQRGDLTQMSFAFTVERDEWMYDQDKDERTILEVRELFDVSLVTYPFYKDATAALRNEEIARRSLEQWKESHQPEPTGPTEEEITQQLSCLDIKLRQNIIYLNNLSL